MNKHANPSPTEPPIDLKYYMPGQRGDVGLQCPSETWGGGSCPGEGTGSHWPDDR